jgi:hypothetical protein
MRRRHDIARAAATATATCGQFLVRRHRWLLGSGSSSSSSSKRRQRRRVRAVVVVVVVVAAAGAA